MSILPTVAKTRPRSSSRFRMTNDRREALAAAIFLAPSVLGFVLLSLGPIVFSLVISLTSWGGLSQPSWVGLQNYVRLLEDKLFRQAAFNTMMFTLMFVPLALVFSIGLALLFDRKVRGTSIVRLLCFLPIVTDFISVSLVWTWMYHVRYGIINYLLGFVNIPAQAWLGDRRLALFALVVLTVWRFMGFYAVIILAALQGVPASLQEAARIDGAGRLQVFFRITLPLITPAVFFVMIDAIISSLQVFEQMFIMTEGGPRNSTISVAMFMYQQGFLYLKMGYASAVAWMLFFAIFFFTFINWQVRRRWVYED